ncbi:MAG: ComF family protein [Bacteroidaceae bacterium]|nr:ComF family protein [Bacteroidaceae bacterium]
MDFYNSYGFGTALLDFFLPRRCVVCDDVLGPSETHLCEACWGDLPHTYYWMLRNNPMADRFNGLIQEWLEDKCFETREISTDAATMASNPNGGNEVKAAARERYAYAAALFFYRAESDYRKITRCIKYQGRLEVGKHFGRLLGERLAGSSLFSDVDLVVPVPLHWLRRWKRGYNQAEVIASGVAECLGIPMRPDILSRIRRTRTQTRLSIAEKRANVSGAFAIPAKPPAEPTPFRHILLVDDVFTTGSTLGACFAALRSVFPPTVRISVVTLGFVGGS